MERKVCVVTGSSSGIGAATARLMTARGARVVVADIEHAVRCTAGRRIGQRSAAGCRGRRGQISLDSMGLAADLSGRFGSAV